MQRRAFEFGCKGAIASAKGRVKRPAREAKSRTRTSDMRLICPNCSAQYEVDASLIPDEGRDVQCSNCGHNWFELPPAVEAAAPPPEMMVEDEGASDQGSMAEAHEDVVVAEVEPEADMEPEPDVEPEPEVVEASEPEPEATTDVEPEPEPVSEPEEDRGDEAPQDDAPYKPDEDDDWNWPKTRLLGIDPAPVDTPERARRPADLAALEILKEEADRELAKRKLPPEPEPIEVQPDLVPAEDPRDRETPSRALRARMARLRGEDEEEEAAEAEAKAVEEAEDAYREPRKDLLPDIEEINSSLRPAGLARGERSEAEEAEHRRGFRIGFIGIVAAMVLAILTYAQAPAIAGALPGTETTLIGYVDWANGVRDALSGLFGG